MGTVASELKSEREKRKISLAHIASETHISLRHLESLEEGRFSDLPGGIYNRAFLRAYCEALKLDNLSEILQRYESELPANSERTAKSKIYVPPKSRSFRISPMFIWGIMLLLSSTGLFFSKHWITAIFSPYFSHAPAATVPYEPAPQPKPGQNPIQPAASMPGASAQATTVQPIASQQAPIAQAPSTSTQPGGLNRASDSGIEPKAPSPEPPPDNADILSRLRVEIRATATCWVSVDKDGTPVFRKVMRPGEVEQLPAGEKFLVILGNAGGINLKINGKPAKPLGKPGEVVKLMIDASKVQELLDQATGL